MKTRTEPTGAGSGVTATDENDAAISALWDVMAEHLASGAVPFQHALVGVRLLCEVAAWGMADALDAAKSGHDPAGHLADTRQYLERSLRGVVLLEERAASMGWDGPAPATPDEDADG